MDVYLKTIETETGPTEIYVHRYATQEEYDAHKDSMYRTLARIAIENARDRMNAK